MAKPIFKLEIDSIELDRLFRDLPKVTKRATANTVNFVARKVNANIKKDIEGKFNIPKSEMKLGDLVWIKRANANRNIGTASIFIKKKGRGLEKYGALQVKSGLVVAVRNKAEKIKSAFLAPWQKGSGDIKAMAKGKGRRAGKITRITKAGTVYQADKRQQEWGPQIATLYINKTARIILIRTIDKEFQLELDKQFNRQFEKKL
jgi:hypothetical protein